MNAVQLAAPPDPAWPVIVLAIILLGDVAMSFRPPGFIRACLDGVGLPRDWWWVLIVVKLLAAAGLLLGLLIPGLALAAAAGTVVYFLCAAAAHLRARFLGSAFWLNCLGLLAVSFAVLAALIW